jgi:hypothetical protein
MLRGSTHQDAYFMKRIFSQPLPYLRLALLFLIRVTLQLVKGPGGALRLAQSSAEPLLVMFVARLLALLQVPQPAR